jgi:SAM-dependent methyltransferase
MSKQWYENWFDSPYYHKLYFDRDEQEASAFITNLIQHLQPASPSFMLDVACGKGRHARTLASFNHFVTGIDISPQSIAYASQYNSDLLEFLEHDMRLTFRINYYNYVFNLFTSFGYFDTHRKNEDTLRTIYQSLKPGGIFVFDYLNAAYTASKLVPADEKIIDGTRFLIKRYKTSFHFVKQIQIEDQALAMPLLFEEKVASYTKNDFEAMFTKIGFKVQAIFGNYKLEEFEEAQSPRVIIVAQK